MKTTLAGSCDREGHRAAATALVVLGWLVWPATAAAQRAGNYAASSFDVALTVVEGGDLDVTETITFDFESGRFKRVWREIPAARTDGVQITHASRAGRTSAIREGAGHIKVSGRHRVTVEWQVEPVGPSAHPFELRCAHCSALGVDPQSSAVVNANSEESRCEE